MKMDYNKKHRLLDTTLGEWLHSFPNNLDADAVGLWQIIPTGRTEFELEGKDLQEFTRQALQGLFRRGVLPVLGHSGRWIVDPSYGAVEKEIISNILAKWTDEGSPEPDVEDVWFVLKEFAELG